MHSSRVTPLPFCTRGQAAETITTPHGALALTRVVERLASTRREGHTNPAIATSSRGSRPQFVGISLEWELPSDQDDLESPHLVVVVVLGTDGDAVGHGRAAIHESFNGIRLPRRAGP
jgi:hypothetical protein